MSNPLPLEPLTQRELEVLRLLAEGHSNKEVATQLVISVGTVKWYVQQIFSKLGVRRRTEAVARARELNLLETASTGESAVKHKSYIPIQTTSFIGRQTDIDEVGRLLLNQTGCRLLTLLGYGGIGKTRLALAVATMMINEMQDGVYFVSLAPISDVEDVVPAIAQSLNFTFYGKTDPTEQLLDFLKSKRLLLILDNFEHLLDGVTLLSDILKHAPHVLLLTTSRERLKLQEEWVYEVSGLSYPAIEKLESESRVDVEQYQAVQLFLHRARQAKISFSPHDEIVDIARICQLVEGMPLGLELAAGWIRTLSCNEIALEIERSLDFLTSSQHNVLERHQSLRVVIEQTWQHLSSDEKSVMSRLSIFRGGCTRDAAQAVTGTTLAVMSSLIDKALLRRTDTGRFEIHELIRQFSAEHLEQDGDQLETVIEQHRLYFIAFLDVREADVKGRRQKEALNEIKADIDNMRLAWRQSVAQHDAEAIERAAECLFVFYLYSSGHYEGQEVFRQAFAAFAGADNSPDDLAGFLLACQGYFLGRTVDPFTGETLIHKALELIRRAEVIDRHKEGFAMQWMSWMFVFQGRQADVLANVEVTLEILHETGDKWSEAWALLNWANNINNVQPLKAEEIYKQGMALCREIGDLSNIGYYCQTRSICNNRLGRYAVAMELAEEAVRIFEEMNSVLGLGYALRSRGDMALTLGKFEQSIRDLQQAVRNFSEVRTEHNVIWAQHDLGTALRLKGDYAQSEQLYNRALNAANASENKGHVIWILVGLGCLAHGHGDWKRAEDYLLEAMGHLLGRGIRYGLARVSGYLANVLVDADETRRDDTNHYLQQALHISMELKLAPSALYACAVVAKLKARLHEEGQAIMLATLAAHHESSDYETRELARQILAHLKLNSITSAAVDSHSHDLWSIVQTILLENTAN